MTQQAQSPHRTLQPTLGFILIAALLALLPTADAQCFYRDGSSASNDGYLQCPGEDFCCPDLQFCETNGLCRDKNNHANGSLTLFPSFADPGPYNYTGLYQTLACSNRAWDGCAYECTASNASTFNYVWACTDDLESYCCHAVQDELGPKDCCDLDTRFLLQSPVAVISASSSSSAGSTIASTGTAAAQSTGSASAATSAAAASAAPTGNDGQGGGGLSKGAKIGIGVGVPLGILLALALGVLFWRTQRLHKHLAAQREGGGFTQGNGEGAGGRWTKAELADSQRAPPSELDGNRPPRELDGADYQRAGKEKQAPMSPVEM